MDSRIHCVLHRMAPQHSVYETGLLAMPSKRNAILHNSTFGTFDRVWSAHRDHFVLNYTCYTFNRPASGAEVRASEWMNGTHCDRDWHRLITWWARKIKCTAVAIIYRHSVERRLHNSRSAPIIDRMHALTCAKLNYIARVSRTHRIDAARL